MINKKGVLGILLSCLAIVLFLSMGEGEKESSISKTKIEEEVVKKEKPRRELIPKNPEDYGMIVFEEEEEPVTQGEWDELLEREIGKIEFNTSPQTWAKLKEAIKEEPQKTKEKIKDIDKRLKEVEAILKEEPDNRVMQKRSKHLKMLRAISRSLAP